MMRQSYLRSRTTILTAAATAVALGSVSLRAIDRTWTGNTDGAWGTADNWDGGLSIPSDGDNILFADVTNQTITLGADRTIGNLTFNAADAYAVNAGNSLIFGSAGLSLTQSGAGTVSIAGPVNWGANGITLGGAGAGQVTLNALTGTSTINVTGGNYLLNADNSTTLTAGTKWNLTGGVLSLANFNRLGYAPGAVVGDYLTLNGGTLRMTAGSVQLGNRGLTVSGTSTIDSNGQNDYGFNTANTLLGSGRLIVRNGGRLTTYAKQEAFTGTIQLGNGTGAGNARSEFRFSVNGNSNFNGNIEINDPVTDGPQVLASYGNGAAGTITLTGNVTFTGQVWKQPHYLTSRYTGTLLNFGPTSVLSTGVAGNAGWFGFKAGGDVRSTNQMLIAGTIQDGLGKTNVAYVDGGGNWQSYKVSGDNSYTGGGTLASGASYGNQLGTQIQQGTVFWGHANALGANNVSNAISIFRSTGSRPSVYAGLLADVAADSTLGNQQTITVRPLNGNVNAFTIGGNGAVNTAYNNPIVVSNPGGGGAVDGSSGFGLLLHQASGGQTTFAGSITASGWATAQMKAPVFEKTGAGTVVLQSAVSSLKATPVIRNGTLLVEANAAATGDTGALGDPTITDYGQSNAIQLGGARDASALSNVRIVTVGDIGGTYSAAAGTNGNGQITGVTNNTDALNNTTLAVNDRVLVLLQGNSNNTAGSASIPAANGIYTVTSTTGTVTLDRAADPVALGTWVTANVVAGKVLSGKTFYLANQNTTFNNGGASGTVQFWLEDEGANTSAALNPALLTNAAVTIARDIRVNASPAIQTSTLGGNSDHNSTFSGGVTLNRDLRLTSVATGTNKTTLSGVINDLAGSFAVEKVGAGRLELTNANTYDGGTTVTAGTLLVNNASGSGTGTGSVSVNAGTLGGTGSVAGNITVAPAATVAPGNSVGTLTAGADATFAANSILSVELESSASYDSLVVSGVGLFNGNLAVSLLNSFVPASGDVFTIISGTNVTGAVGNLNGQGKLDVTGGTFDVLFDSAGLKLTNFTGTATFLKGDMNDDDLVNNQDIAPFVQALTDYPGYQAAFPGVDGVARGDINLDTLLNNQDIAPFVALLTGGRPLSEFANDPDFAPLLNVVPEPTALSLLALGGLVLRRRRAQ